MNIYNTFLLILNLVLLVVVLLVKD